MDFKSKQKKTQQNKKQRAKFVSNVNPKGNCFVCFNSLKVTNGKRQAYNTVLAIQIHYLIPRLAKEMKLFTAFLGKKK